MQLSQTETRRSLASRRFAQNAPSNDRVRYDFDRGFEANPES